ncbi:MAG: hypothetical protein RIQ56_376 [Candidatus Parcubacteria bacterium]|jgi:arginyl-tRNA synthetase
MALVDDIKNALSHALKNTGVEIAPNEIPLELVSDLQHGDYATSVALAKAKDVGTSPRVLAEKIVAQLGSIPGIASIQIAGPGFINFALAPRAVASIIEEARKSEDWGISKIRGGEVILMEYTDPNPFKEFHIGHLMPNAIGESLSRLFSYTGATVLRANYQGDVGVHVAKSLYVQLKNNITDPTIADLAASYPEGSRLYEEDGDAKKEIDELNKTIYAKSDPAVNSLYEKGRKLSLDHFEELYKILGTKFDYYFFESVTGPAGKEIVLAHPEVFEESEGAVVFKGERYGLHTRVFLNKLGLPTYEAKELGLAALKMQTTSFNFTMTITAQEQADYFKVVSKAIELAMPETHGKIRYKTHGMMRFAEGKMSSRTGNVITGESLLNDLIEEAKVRASESRADDPDLLAQQVAVAAIKFQILRQGLGKDIIFDRTRALSLEGDSGPYLQYAHARTCAILTKAKEADVQAAGDVDALPNTVARLVTRFPQVVARSAEYLEPHLVTTYLIELAAAFNSWYAQEQILDGTPSAAHKVAVVDAVRSTLRRGLWVLGIPAPEKM